jgi:CHAT domain-containing protein/tetratricopeptide (TPR) repeat protein
MRVRRLLLLKLALAFLLLSNQECLGQSILDIKNQIGPGVVVEEVNKNYAAAAAGLRKGDILLRWKRGNASGKIHSPFDLWKLEWEQGTLGTVTISGSRANQNRSWIMGHDSWFIATRPNFGLSLLNLYSIGRKFAVKDRFEAAVAEWLKIVDPELESSCPWLRSWLIFTAADLASQAQQWTSADGFYDAAIRNAFELESNVVPLERLRWADTIVFRNELDRGLALYQQTASQILRTSGESAAYAFILNSIGLTYIRMGDWEHARESFNRVVNMETGLSPGDIFESAIGNMYLGTISLYAGDIVDAERHTRISLAGFQKLAPKSFSLGQALENLARIASERGDFRTAHRYFFESAYLRRGSALLTTRSMLFLAGLAHAEGDLRSWEAYLHRALASLKKYGMRGDDIASSLDTATVLNEFGILEHYRGNWTSSEKYLLRGLAIVDSPSGDQFARMELLNDLADLQRDRGNLDGAEVSYRRALELRRKLFPGTARYAAALGGLADVMRLKQQGDKAANLYEQALNALENQSAHLGGGEDLRSEFRAKHENYYREYADLLIDQKQPERAFEVLERSRARTLLETLAAAHVDVRKGVDASLVEQERALHQKLTAESNYRVQLVGGQHTEEKIKEVDRQIAGVLSQYEDIEGRIRVASPAYAALTQPQPLTDEQARQLLDDDTVLLEYSLGKDRSLLFAVTPSNLNTYGLPKRAEIEKQARMVHNLISACTGNIAGETPLARQARIRAARQRITNAAAELSRMILSPVAEQIKGKRLLIVSDGALAYIPFAMLPSPSSTGAHLEPLVVEHEIVNVPSASVLAALRQQQANRPQAPKAVAVLADPVFAKDDARVANLGQKPEVSLAQTRSTEGMHGDSLTLATDLLVRSAGDVGLKRHRGELHFARLPFSRQEAEAVAGVVPKSEMLQALDFRASRSTALSPDLAQYRIVHFATHGLLDSRHPELSGLVLSLVNKRGRPENGFLDLQDIYNMNLGADLVVLSACETGLGKEVDGEGLMGLTRGFMYAGASRVMASLWKVSDAGTAQLMGRFYRAMEQEGMRPAAALRSAQIQMWREKRWGDPYYWAAFQIQGEWR